MTDVVLYSSLTKGSAMMMRILRSDCVVKLAKRLLRTYSPGRLSGSMLMGIMAGGAWLQHTGGMGGLLYPNPTGEAGKNRNKLKLSFMVEMGVGARGMSYGFADSFIIDCVFVFGDIKRQRIYLECPQTC